MSSVDRLTESAARWTASRLSRRTFLANAGKVAVATAAGSAVTAVLAQQAQARVCGQSGVSPKCPTFDCVEPAAWGYCWYASPGCCTNGGLKKICDCCLKGWPNVQGYCPTGSAVYCVVESCLEDPRVQSVILDRWTATNPVSASLQRIGTMTGAPVVVLANAADTLSASLGAPIARELNAPLVGVDPANVPNELLEAFKRLQTSRVVLAGGGFTAQTIAGLTAAGFAVEELAPGIGVSDAASASVAVARWLIARTGRPELIVIGTDGPAGSVAPAAAAFAAGRRSPLVVGVDAAAALNADGVVREVIAIGESIRSRISGAVEFTKGSPTQLSLQLADNVIARDSGSLTVGFASPSSGGFGTVVCTNNVVIIHESGSVSDELRGWLTDRRRRFARAEICTAAPATLDNGAIYFLQSAISGFDAHLLTGSGGDGLPVYSQPLEEQALGKARVAGELPAALRSQAAVRRSRIEDRWPVPTVAMPPPTSWPPGKTTTTLPPASQSTTRPPRPAAPAGSATNNVGAGSDSASVTVTTKKP